MDLQFCLSFFEPQLTQPPTLSQNVLDLIFNASIVAKAVLGILVFFSLISWTIIIDKLRVFGRVRRDSERFKRLFHRRKSPKEILQASRLFPNSPFAAVFKEAYWLLSKKEETYPNPGNIEMLKEQKSDSRHTSDDLVRLFDSVASSEVLKLEKYLVFLATTGSVSPFFGLFGTVWGVMSAFLAIGFTGSADLSVVAPGIAEALITTVAGLGAAIPAVVAYNYFVNRLKRLSSELEIFYANLIEAFAKRETHEVR
ncbi:Tol-Pal system subunit TolQ [candidate division KSB1 bacterium]|nr:Tol-Pal system subunit TolQ [candidate division KSB1 bacterium]NIR72662.1 Tol-Pal system subunit TolQ [candidate division KSB1 bacterium]NIS23692.1 Tol-Pal system subunit TolQ [candidate division KSB1 bacterium]NIT70612.1 Tol-Pal system subunit TolQ [candidate division KSB1 bacterium]NIU24340.1 Tol-Pal system subunit TolQ [candidate division KSB1 bacterium]